MMSLCRLLKKTFRNRFFETVRDFSAWKAWGRAQTKGGPESLHEPKIRDALDVSSICPCGCFLLLLADLNIDINMRMCFCCLYGVMATQHQLPFADFEFFSFREWLGPPFCFALGILAFTHEHFPRMRIFRYAGYWLSDASDVIVIVVCSMRPTNWFPFTHRTLPGIASHRNWTPDLEDGCPTY